MDNQRKLEKLLKDVEGWIDEYETWISKNITISDDWIDEIEYMAYIRTKIDKSLKKLSEENISLEKKYANTIHKLDLNWKKQINNAEDTQILYQIDRKIYPRSQWWWWIDEIKPTGK